MRIVIKGLFIVLLLLGLSPAAEAQSVMYIDEAGNIHFASNLYEVPQRYREQIAPEPTQAPMTAKQRRKMERDKEREVKHKEREERKQARLEEKARKKRARELKRKKEEEQKELRKITQRRR
jgi:flagellar biosynthesis GTPase FlhF